MKKTILILSTLMLGSSTMLTSCADDYLDTVPTQSVSDETVFATADNLMTAINGMHRNMYYRQDDSQGRNGYTAQLIFQDALGEDLIFPATGNNWFISMLRYNESTNEASANVSYPWDFWYRMIKNANNIIVNGDKATGDVSLKQKAIGEAYAYRAFSNFQLVQLFANRYENGKTNSQDGIIIRLDPRDNSPKARATVEEVYSQIWNDLDKAQELLTGKSKTNNSHFALDNVLGLKARVALVQQKYKEASEYANLARKGKSLMSQTDYKKGFNDYNNSEWMWGVSIAPDQSDGFGNFMAYMSRNYNSGQIRQSPKVVNKLLFKAFSTSDVRTQVISESGKHPELNLGSTYSLFPYTSQKFITKNNDNSLSLGDVPFMRSAEMYLIEAEAKYFLGDEAGSKAVLTELTIARNSEFKTFTTSGSAYLAELMLNRRLELWGEGFRFLDLKRTNSPLNRRETGANAAVINNVWEIPAGDTRWTWMIPRQEINANPLCKPNPSNK